MKFTPRTRTASSPSPSVLGELNRLRAVACLPADLSRAVCLGVRGVLSGGDVEEERLRRRGVRTSLLLFVVFFVADIFPFAFYNGVFWFFLCFFIYEFSGIFPVTRCVSSMKMLNDTVYSRAFCLRGRLTEKNKFCCQDRGGSRNIHRHHSIRRAPWSWQPNLFFL